MKEPLEQRGFSWRACDTVPETPEVEFGDMTDLCYGDNTFDFVFVCHALEHCEQPITALREFLRILKPGGFLFSATPFPCDHHVLEADDDHLFVLEPMHWIRLLRYTKYADIRSGVLDALVPQDRTIITIGRKP